MYGFPYHNQPVAPPDNHPCLTCRTHGPDCTDCCPLLDAWLKTQEAERQAAKEAPRERR